MCFSRILFFFIKIIPHLFCNHCFFSLLAYSVFAKDVLTQLDDKKIDPNSLIHTVSPYLGQWVVDWYIDLVNLMAEGFLKEKNIFSQVEDNFDDFLTGKVIFTSTSTKICLRTKSLSSFPPNMLDKIIHFHKADVPAFSSLAIDNYLSCIGFPEFTVLTPILDARSVFSVRSASAGTFIPLLYLFNRQISSVIDL